MKILVDTSVWIEYLKNRPAVANHLDRHLLAGNIFIVGPVIAELLQGARTEKDYHALNNSIDGLPFVETDLNDWTSAGNISFKLRRKGLTVPITDCLIAAVAIRLNAAVMTYDRHFEHIPDLTLEKTPE
jgi:tRNA(fMet)-specific endonuclease VapC